jgi:hypothetical protein
VEIRAAIVEQRFERYASEFYAAKGSSSS